MGHTIDDYKKKRDFGRTPEPAPGEYRRGEGDPSFVIHRHDARRLHWDLRLEMEGVLKSWAVPRGLSWNPEDKHLAVRTEDHPMEYLVFSGEIPKGEYGAGTLKIWDSGTYRILNEDGEGGVQSGKLEILLMGRRTRGEWHMVRIKPQGDEDPWLLFKASDKYAREDDASEFGPMLEEAKIAPFPRSRKLMTAASTRDAFNDPEWLFEMEFVGRRVLAFKRDGDVKLVGEDVPSEVPGEMKTAFQALRADHAVLDGVLVVVDGTGRPSKERLLKRLRGRSDDPLQLYVFDLLYWEGFDLRAVPLIDRKAVLARTLPSRGPLLFVDHVPGTGEAVAAACAAGGVSGVVAKRADGTYRAGASKDWVHIPVAVEDEARRKVVTEALGAVEAAQVSSDRVKLSNMNKVFFPAEGFTKGDLVNYYARVCDYLLPHLKDRVLHMRRCPDGIEGEFFYQREAPGHLPDWIDTEVLPVNEGGKPQRHFICNHRDALLYLVNLGSVDLHPWLSRVQTPNNPDVAAIDLDPKEAPFEHVVRIARAVGKLLRAINVRAYLKTSGATGLHIYIPLTEGYTYDHSRMFCEGVCRVVHRELRDISTIERDTRRRGGRVYLDFLQNRRGQTLVPAYSVRPVPGATVSTPLHWEELDGQLHPSLFDITNVPDRIARHGELFRPVLEDRQDLLPAIEALQEVLKG